MDNTHVIGTVPPPIIVATCGGTWYRLMTKIPIATATPPASDSTVASAVSATRRRFHVTMSRQSRTQ